jgi:hypothetical protein
MRTYGTFQVHKNKDTTATSITILCSSCLSIWYKQDAAMSTTQFSIHNAQVGFMRSTKDKGTPRGMDINKLAPHGSLGTMNSNLLFGIIVIFHIEYGISCRKRRSLAQDPTLGIQGKDLCFSRGSIGTIFSRIDFCFAHSYGSIATISFNLPPACHACAERILCRLVPILVDKSRYNSCTCPRHGIIHSPANVVGRVGRRSSISNGCLTSIERPVRCGRFRFSFVFVFGCRKL